MRTIKFRGRRLDNGEWVYGSLIQNVTDKGVNVAFIVPYLPCASEPHDMWTAEMFRVNPSTIGQLTGLTDSNDKEIYEGDIVMCYRKNEGKFISVVMYLDEYGFFCVLSEEKEPILLCEISVQFTVIGNIHDNPQLLKSENK